MRTCPTCGRTVGDNVKFCPGCGGKLPQGNVCPACGRENREGMAFCRYCGVPLQGKEAAPGEGALNRPQGLNPAQPQSQPQGQPQGQPQNWAQPMPGQTLPGQAMPGQQPNRTEPAPAGEKKPKKKMSRGKKAALFGGLGVVLLGIIAVLVLFVFRPMTQVQKVDPNSLYARGCEVYYLNEKGEEVPLTNQLFTDNSIDNQMMASDGPSLGYYIAVSDDGTRIFYPDQAQTDAYGPSLYTRLLSEPADKAVMIDSEVAQFQITSDGKKVTYIRGGDHALYQSDLEKKTRIAADVAAFTGSPDGQTVFYADATGVMYQWTSEGGAKQIAGNAAVIKGIATDKMAAYYIQDGALYEQVAGSDAPKQIATDVQKVVWITPDGQVYFTADGTDGATMMDFVEDDLAGGTCTFGSRGVKPVAFSQDGSVAYTAQYDQNNPGNKPALYRTPIEDGKLGEPEAITTAAAPLQVLQDGRLVYGIVRDGRQTMDLCVGGANAATIHQYPLTGKEIQGADGKSLAYFSSWDIETESGTLNVWCDGESVTVSSNVQSFQMREDGSVLYLYDFDENAGTGTLGLYQNGTMTVLNHDTNCLIPTTDRVLYGDY